MNRRHFLKALMAGAAAASLAPKLVTAGTMAEATAAPAPYVVRTWPASVAFPLGDATGLRSIVIANEAYYGAWVVVRELEHA